MRRVCLAVVLLALTAACGQPAQEPSRTVVAAGSSIEPAPEPTTTAPPTTVLRTTLPAPATTVSPPTTARRPTPPATTATTAPRPTTTSTTIHPPTATVSALGATVALSATLRDLVPGFRFAVDVTTAPLQYIERVKWDYGDGQIWEHTPGDPNLCSRQPRVVSHSGPKTWMAPGTYRVRVTVTIVPCWPAVGPPGSPDGAPLPEAPRHPVEVSLTVTQDQGINEPLRRP
jgi:hypothetical protein